MATDTLAVSPDGRPLCFTTKALILPHLKMIVAGTGAGGFLDRWYLQTNSRMAVRGIDHLNYHAPSNLSAIWSGYKEEFSVPEKLTTTVYHFGFSEVTGLIHSYAYRSTNSFQSELLPYGLAVKPACTVPSDPRLPDDIRKMMDEQRSTEASKTLSQRLYIGGEIQVHHLTKEGFAVYTLDRFDDYGRDEQIIYKR